VDGQNDRHEAVRRLKRYTSLHENRKYPAFEVEVESGSVEKREAWAVSVFYKDVVV
jgi:hypothetical protein